jgi:outer membrane protein OmpA-like peptidoglycan-associated protein
MIGLKLPVRGKSKDEAEKPFWISFSDLMTALMVLFLVAMTVALLAVTKEISEAEKNKIHRQEEINELLSRVKKAAKEFSGITVVENIIDFGERARFGTDSSKLEPEQVKILRAFIPKVLDIARDPLGQKWLKQIVVEGFADQRGTYLHNLNLSLQRSERVLCELLMPPQSTSDALGEADRLLARELFLVGGASFNSLKPSLDASRRIELRLEFRDKPNDERTSPNNAPLDNDSRCPIDLPQICPTCGEKVTID